MAYGNSRQRRNRSKIIPGYRRTNQAQLPHPITAADLHNGNCFTVRRSSSGSTKAGGLGSHKSHSGGGTGARGVLVVAAHVTGRNEVVAKNLARET